jgi:hypothetical protein
VYRQASGHAYRSVYPGPVGAVLSPLLMGERFAENADLPKASSLFGACHEVFPVNIPFPAFSSICATGRNGEGSLRPARRRWADGPYLPPYRQPGKRRFGREALGLSANMVDPNPGAAYLGAKPNAAGPARWQVPAAPEGAEAMSERDEILGRVKEALLSLRERAALPEYERDLAVVRQVIAGRDLLAVFAECAQLANGLTLTDSARLAAHLRANQWLHGYCDPALWPGSAPHFCGDFTVETQFARDRVDDYAFGIMRARGAVAETGAIIFDDRSTSRRRAALAS